MLVSLFSLFNHIVGLFELLLKLDRVHLPVAVADGLHRGGRREELLHVNLLQIVVDQPQDFAAVISSVNSPRLDLVPAVDSTGWISNHVEAALALILLSRTSSKDLEDIRFRELRFHSVLVFKVTDSFVDAYECVCLQFGIETSAKKLVDEENSTVQVLVLRSHLDCIIYRVDNLVGNFVEIAHDLDFFTKLRLIKVFEHEVRLVEEAFFKVFDKSFSQVLFGLSKNCPAFERLKSLGSRDLLLALAFQDLLLLDVVDLAEQLPVVLIVGSREEIGLLTMVNSNKTISPVLKIFWVLSTLIFLDNESTPFKHGIDFVNNVHKWVIFVVLEVFDNNHLNVVV